MTKQIPNEQLVTHANHSQLDLDEEVDRFEVVEIVDFVFFVQQNIIQLEVGAWLDMF